MDGRAQRRAQWIPHVAKIMRSTDFRASMTTRLGGREHTIIVVLPDDEMGYVFDRLKDAGGSGVVALPSEEQLQLATIWPASPERLVVAQEDDALAHIHRSVDVTMFFALLRSTEGPVVFQQLAARLVDHGELQPV